MSRSTPTPTGNDAVTKIEHETLNAVWGKMPDGDWQLKAQCKCGDTLAAAGDDEPQVIVAFAEWLARHGLDPL